MAKIVIQQKGRKYGVGFISAPLKAAIEKAGFKPFEVEDSTPKGLVEKFSPLVALHGRKGDVVFEVPKRL